MTTPPVDLDTIARDLKATFPELGEVAVTRVLGEGFRSLAVETEQGLVFRIGKESGAAEGYVREARFLPILQRALAGMSIRLPYPEWHSGPSDRFPFGVLGYEKLPGTPLHPDMLWTGEVSREQIAPYIGWFLLALYSFPPDDAMSLGLPGPDARVVQLEAMRDEVLPALKDQLLDRDYDPVRRWWDSFLSDRVMREYRPSVVHGDLWYENMLVGERANGEKGVVGILDFENVAVADPAQDFATQLHLGQKFADTVVQAFRDAGGVPDRTFDYRVRRLWELREFEGVQYAVRTGDEAEMEDSLRKLRNGPLLGKRQHVPPTLPR